MIRLPIQQVVQKITRELTKPNTKQETTVLATGTRIHYVNFEKIRKYKPQAFGGKAEIELKDLSNVSKTPYETYYYPRKR